MCAMLMLPSQYSSSFVTPTTSSLYWAHFHSFCLKCSVEVQICSSCTSNIICFNYMLMFCGLLKQGFHISLIRSTHIWSMWGGYKNFFKFKNNTEEQNARKSFKTMMPREKDLRVYWLRINTQRSSPNFGNPKLTVQRIYKWYLDFEGLATKPRGGDKRSLLTQKNILSLSRRLSMMMQLLRSRLMTAKNYFLS